MRPASVWAVAARDLRRVRGGRGRWSMLGLALALVVPLASVPCGGATSAVVPKRETPRRLVSGSPPPAVTAAAGADVVANARLRVERGPPVSVAVGAGRVPVWLREPLDELSGPRVSVLREDRLSWIPGRNLWVLLLAASLLTGPLVESIPGERAQRTWETLRSSAISSVELLTGKWLAWTLSAVFVSACGLLAGLLSGTQTADVSMWGIPLVLASVVALGLWLVHDVDDPAGAATIPVRVIPLVLVGAALASGWLQSTHPMLASLVPFGGPLLLAAGFPGSSVWLPGALLSSVLLIAGMLGWTARQLEADRRRAAVGRLAGIMPVMAAAWVWWAALVGPQLWSVAGSPLRPGATLPALAGATGLMLVAAVSLLRSPDSHRGGRLTPERRRLPGWVPVIGGLGLAQLARWLPELSVGGGLQPVLSGQPVSLWWPAVLLAIGQEVCFRGTLTTRLGPWGAAVAWALVTRPLDPAMGVLGGAWLGWCHHRGGMRACVGAHVVWVAVSTLG